MTLCAFLSCRAHSIQNEGSATTTTKLNVNPAYEATTTLQRNPAYEGNVPHRDERLEETAQLGAPEPTYDVISPSSNTTAADSLATMEREDEYHRLNRIQHTEN